jgi:hypothetical protein
LDAYDVKKEPVHVALQRFERAILHCRPFSIAYEID